MNITDQIKTTLTLVPVDTTDPLVCTLRNQLIECDSELATLRAELEKVTKERDEALRWARERDDTIRRMNSDFEQTESDAKELWELMRMLDRSFGCGHAEHGTEDCRELVRHVDETIAERDAALSKLEEVGSILSTVAATSVQQLRDRYLASMKRENEKDKPDGFDSWEAYHKHVIDLRAQLAAARADSELIDHLEKYGVQTDGYPHQFMFPRITSLKKPESLRAAIRATIDSEKEGQQ